MMDETFSPSFGSRPAQLVGREAEVAEFLEALEGPVGHPNRASLYIGNRGMGKTALLLELAEQAAAAGFVVAQVLVHERMLDEIIELIQLGGAKYIPKGKRVKGFSASALGFSLGLTFTDEVRRDYGFRVKLSLLCDALAGAGHGVLILVDEVVSTSPQMRELSATFQQLRGERKDIAIAMAALPASMSSVLNDEVLTFLNRAHKVQLGPIRLNDVAVFYTQAFTRLGKTFSAEVIQQMTEASFGYPYLLQLIGYHAQQLLGDELELTATTVELAIGNARRELADDVYAPALKQLSARDLAFLNAMAVDDGSSQIKDVAARAQMSRANAQQYRARLLEAGLIASTARGEIEFVLPYLGTYLREQT
ncbi:MAG: AAA family ATPase [Propionibacteriaceae bacterium]|jgi:hypothetical protein|nr:AAA family ATPase [Propionibacteriaceae bacterium]